MLSVTVEELEQVAILHCSGRIVRGNGNRHLMRRRSGDMDVTSFSIWQMSMPSTQQESAPSFHCKLQAFI